MVDKILNLFLDNNIPVNDDSAKKLLFLYDSLVSFNSKYNLTSIIEFDDVLFKHFLDSALLVREISIKENTKIIDVGSGAGFPGLVLAIIRPDINISLLESSSKKSSFQDYITDKIDLNNCSVLNGRAEEFGKDLQYRETFDYAISRAVANTNVLLEYMMPFLKIGGYTVCYKGSDYQTELVDISKPLNLLGGKSHSVISTELPFGYGKRTFIIFKKTTKTPDKYPRRNGLPLKRPLT